MLPIALAQMLSSTSAIAVATGGSKMTFQAIAIAVPASLFHNGNLSYKAVSGGSESGGPICANAVGIAAALDGVLMCLVWPGAATGPARHMQLRNSLHMPHPPVE